MSNINIRKVKDAVTKEEFYPQTCIEAVVDENGDALGIDASPTEDSDKLVRSGGVKAAIDNEATARANADSALGTRIDGANIGIQAAMAAVNAEQQRATQAENAKYVKPNSGIPKADLASDVQASLELATDVVYDISAHNNNTAYASLAAALGTGGANIPQSLRKGGMSVRFVLSSDNKYVQYMLTKQTWSVEVYDWEQVNVEKRLDELEDFLVAKNDVVYPIWTDGMIYNVHSVSTNAAYQKTDPIKMYIGDTITFTGGSDSTAVSVIAIAEYNNGSYEKILYYSGLTQEIVTWTAPKECYVVISTQKTLYTGNITIVRKGEINRINKKDEEQTESIVQLQDEVIGVLAGQNTISGVLGSDNKFGSHGKSACIGVNTGDSYKIVGNLVNFVIIAFLKEYPVSGNAVLYATGSERTIINPPYREISGTIPSDAKYLLVSVEINNNSWAPSAIYFNGINYYDSINQKIYNLEVADKQFAEWQRNNQNLGYIQITTTLENGYYIEAGTGQNATKNTSSQSNYVVTSPVLLKKGDTLFINCTPINKHPIVAFCLSDGTLREVAVNSDGTTNQKTYYLYAKEDCYVVLSFNSEKEYTIWKVANLPEHLSCSDVYMRYGVNTNNTYYDYDTKQFSPGNNVWCSMTVNVAGKLFIDFSTYLPTGVSSSVALFTFLDSDDEYITHIYQYQAMAGGQTYANRVYIPVNAAKVVICQRTGYAKNTVCHIYGQEKNAFAEDLRFNTMREMVSSRAKGIISVGSMTFKNIVNSPRIKEHTQPGAPNAPYFDANESFKQYQKLSENRFIADGVLDGAGKEISFIPESGFLRKIVGKGEDDTFYVSKFPSSVNGGTAGSNTRIILEKTTDFVTFVPLLKGYDNSVDNGLFIDDIHLDEILIVKESADGTLIIGCNYKDDSQPATDGSGNANNNKYLGLLKINQERTSVTFCIGTDINGNEGRVIGSHGLNAAGTAYATNTMYDWHLQTYGNRILMAEYGSRDSLHDDWGRVWYSDNCGADWKEVFQTRNHISEGVEDGSSHPSHTHGCMIDPYSNCIFVIVGETNRNLFYTDKGMDADDSDWTCIPIREQLILPQLSAIQVVNGYPFKDRIVFGSDITGIGAFFALNRLEDGRFSEIEVAHEVLPYNFNTTSYCAGAQSRRDLNSPALLCFTRENYASTEEQNDLLMQQHLGRVVATWDGISFYEIWHDDTYGSHTVRVDGTITTKNISYCTRGMQAWLLHNGDLVIQYAGRNFAFLGGSGYVYAYGDFCSRCQIIKNAERFFVVK